ncbi:MAG: carboxypeptidase-like regulatory domain-containing protein, partial [Bacteroidota bacterium]
MKRKILHTSLICSVLLLFAFGSAMAQTTVSGVVKGDDGTPLFPADVIIEGTTEGTKTDFDGNFELQTDRSAPFNIVISYVGYEDQVIEVTGSVSNLEVALSEGLLIGGDIVISASRKREKVQEAPASISVIQPAQIAASGGDVDPVRSLANTPGVSVSQQSAARLNIEMRASVGLFGTSVFPILDYRSLVGPGIGTFQSDASGLNQIDLARIEVVRGPGSALYGPGVTSGVVHFISKSPIDYPGTTIQAGGGELNTVISSVRHATKISDKFGFKINAGYNRGDEFVLDGSEGTFDAQGNFTSQIDKFQTTIIQPAITDGVVDLTQPGTILLELDTAENGNVMQDFWWNYTVNSTLEFRPTDDLSVNVSGGLNEASAVFYNDLGEGLAQSREWWTQA